MIILQSGASGAGADYIQGAASDCGRVRYYPHGDRTLIDGRDVWRGSYVDTTTGFATSEKVPADLWAATCALFREVDAHNAAVSEMARNADFARQDARAQVEVDAISRLGGVEED